MKSIKIFFGGDIVGRPGRIALYNLLPSIISDYNIDLVICNGENSAGGFGLTDRIAEEIKSYGVSIITTGNHVWNRKDFIPFLDRMDWILRPYNYPEGVPGKGYTIHKLPNGKPVVVLNLEGRVFMNTIDCPFRKADEFLSSIGKGYQIIIVDMHAEATSEKRAMGFYLDGRVSAVIGTHTHVQTADEEILDHGTAYITDVGMIGATDSIIGIKKEDVLNRFLYQIPVKFSMAKKKVKLMGSIISLDEDSGRAVSIERIVRELPPDFKRPVFQENDPG